MLWLYLLKLKAQENKKTLCIIYLLFRIYDATTSSEMTRFKIHRILFCARGKVDTSEARCFAFTSSHGDTHETAIFQCHVFRCQIPEAVSIQARKIS